MNHGEDYDPEIIHAEIVEEMEPGAPWQWREVFWAALLVMLVYSPLLKSRGLQGNLAVAVVASMPLVYGAAAVGYWRAGLVPAVLAAFLHLAREVVKDIEDVPGDLAIGRATVPIAWGVDAGFFAAAGVLALFVPVSLESGRASGR